VFIAAHGSPCPVVRGLQQSRISPLKARRLTDNGSCYVAGETRGFARAELPNYGHRRVQRPRHGQLALPADEAAVFVPVMMAAQKPVATTPAITIETAGMVVRAECGVDVGWLAAVLRVVKGL
jgi:hypothetical protein